MVVIANFHLAIGSSLPKDDSAKGFERDFQMCMDNFYVNTDIIIRTQDSRKLGAKYLNDMDVDSRYDCKRFCCETELCDVFVYEEKVYNIYTFIYFVSFFRFFSKRNLFFK